MLKSFCLGCRHEKDEKNKEPCLTICQARILYIHAIEDPMFKLPEVFRRGNDIITREELFQSIEKPVSFRRKLNKIDELNCDTKPERSRPKEFNKKDKEGFKNCPDCTINPQPLDDFPKKKRGKYGRGTYCKKHHLERYYYKTRRKS